MMTFSLKQKSGRSSTGRRSQKQHLTKSVGGFVKSDSGEVASQPMLRSLADSSVNELVVGVPTSRCLSGVQRSSKFWKGKDTQEMSEFTVRDSGSIGQEILDADGAVVAWTVDSALAQRIVQLLNQ